MTTNDLVNPKIVFDPEPDLEEMPELPGKAVLQDAIKALAARGIQCSKNIQDSHGWCFYLPGDDGRKYLVELTYVITEDGKSQWVLSCARCSGWRLWELGKSGTEGQGREQHYLDLVTEILVTRHAFQKG